MKFLKILGWIFVPYIMIFFQWKKIGTFGKVVGTVWALFCFLAIVIPKQPTDNTTTASKPSSAVATTATAGQNKAKDEADAKKKAEEEAKAAADAEAKAKAEAEANSPKLGVKVTVGKLEALASSVKKASKVGNEFLNKNAQGEFLLIDVEIKNLDKEARMIDSSMFKLVDADGNEYDPDSEASIYANSDNNFFLKNVNPKLSAKGIVVFDMPQGVTGLKLKVDSGVGFAAGESILIDLSAPAKK